MQLCGNMSWKSVDEHTFFHDMLLHNRIINNDLILPSILT